MHLYPKNKARTNQHKNINHLLCVCKLAAAAAAFVQNAMHHHEKKDGLFMSTAHVAFAQPTHTHIHTFIHIKRILRGIGHVKKVIYLYYMRECLESVKKNFGFFRINLCLSDYGNISNYFWNIFFLKYASTFLRVFYILSLLVWKCFVFCIWNTFLEVLFYFWNTFLNVFCTWNTLFCIFIL